MHPPKADDISILDHLFKSLAQVESKYPNCGFLISGDLNRLDINRLLTHFHVKQIVKVPPHKDATLDLVLTNVHEFHTSPLAFPPFGLSDHSAVVASPTSQKVLFFIFLYYYLIFHNTIQYNILDDFLHYLPYVTYITRIRLRIR